MATEFIPITRSAALASKILGARDQLFAARNTLRECKALMAKQVDGSNFGEIETQFGAPVGDGQALQFLVDSLLDNIDVDEARSNTKSKIDAIKVITDALTAAAAAMLAKSASVMLTGTVTNAGLTPTTTQFEASDITEATADHFNGRVILPLTGALKYQASDITDYELASGRGRFTVTAMTEAMANGDTFIII